MTRTLLGVLFASLLASCSQASAKTPETAAEPMPAEPAVRDSEAGRGGRSLSGGSRSLHVAMVIYGDITHDSRVQREAQALGNAGHQVVVYSLPAADGGITAIDGVTVVPIAAPIRPAVPGAPHPHGTTRVGRAVLGAAWMGAYVTNVIGWGLRLRRRATRRDVDIWHLHDFVSLLAVRPWIGRRAFVYDVHELQLEQPGAWGRLPAPAKRFVTYVERWGVKRASLIVTVNKWLADALHRRFGADDIAVLHNCAPRWTPPSRKVDHIRAALDIPASEPIVLYHGLLAPERGLRVILDALPHLGDRRIHAVFMGYGEMRDEIAALAADGGNGHRVHLLDAVPPASLIPWVASADVAVMPIQPTALNGYLSTPNKLFEAIAAGVPVVVSDFPAMSSIALDKETGPIGTTCDPTDPGDVARAIAEIVDLPSEDMESLRSRCRAAANRWNWETESGILLSAYDRVVLATS